MRSKFFAACILLSLFTCLLVFALTPTLVLRVQRADDGASIFCSPIALGDEIFFFSINSIYNAPVNETLRVAEDFSLLTTEVVSTPAVLGYLGIEDYATRSDGQVRGEPKAAHYRELRLLVGARGQQQLLVKGKNISLYQLFPEPTVVIVSVHNQPRLAACF